jgi:hypothetical protein
MVPGFWGFFKQGGLLQGYPFAKNVWYVGSGSPVFGHRASSIADALNLMNPKDVLFLGPQTYTEGDLIVPVGLNNITIIGTGNRGECSIAPSATASNGLLVKSTGVTLVNVDIAQGATGTYACKAGFETTASLNRFTALGCKFEGNGMGLHVHGMSDIILDDCEFAFSAQGIVFQSNSHGFCTEVFVRNCRFHNQTLNQMGEFAAAQQVNSLDVRDCVFENQEGGTAPTDYILLPNNGNTGCFSGNRFATPTNATGVLTIGTGIKWMANATEAGWSTARPA